MQSFLRILRDAVFALVAIVGTVLSIVAVVVVMDLDDPKDVPAAVSVDKLRASLDSSYRVAEKRHAVPVAFGMDSTAWRVAGTDKVSGPAIRWLEPSHKSLSALWEARRTATLAEVQHGAHETALMYGTEAARTGNRDRVMRFDTLMKWHHGQTRRADAYLDTARMELAAVNVAILELRQARDTATARARAAAAWKQMEAAHKHLARSYAFGTVPFRRDVPLVEEVQVVRGGYPQTVKKYHPFASLSAWLRTQGSLELVTIIGMLGFGLVGASASRVVRRDRLSDGTRAPVGDNIANTLLSGVSGALATYLLVKAGLAVASADGAAPNPYLLLVTCFVAAVYWEDAWERVRKAVSGQDANEGGDDGQPRNEAGDPPADEPAEPNAKGKAVQEPAKSKVPVPSIVGDAEATAGAGAPATPGADTPPPAEG